MADISGAGPAVVLLHGQPGGAGDWDRLVPHLAHSFTVVAPDRLGYGRTGGPAAGFEANAAAAIDLLDLLGVEKAIFVGHSWGGAVAIAAAERHPGRVGAMVLLGSVGPAEPIALVDRILASRVLGPLAAAAAIGGTQRLVGVPAVHRRVLPHLPDGARNLLGMLRHPDRDARLWRSFSEEQRLYVAEVGNLALGLASITVPVAVVTGTTDRIVPPDVATRLAGAIPSAELLRVPEVGHLLAHDAPRAVSDAVHRAARRAGMLEPLPRAPEDA